nr:ATP synthase F0 subunit 8 [Daphnia galeata]
MPQIWPMNWIILFILFTLTFTIYLSSVYFFWPNYEVSQQNEEQKYFPGTLEWKW